VAVDAGLVAAQRDHDHVEVGAVVKEALAALEPFDRGGDVELGAKEIPPLESLVHLRAALDSPFDEGFELLTRQENEIALRVGHDEGPVDLAVAEEAREGRARTRDLEEDGGGHFSASRTRPRA
jgi:hypothetical protein